MRLFLDQEHVGGRSAGWANSAGGRFLCVYKPNSPNVAPRCQKKFWLFKRQNAESLQKLTRGSGRGTPSGAHALRQTAATRRRTRDGDRDNNARMWRGPSVGHGHRTTADGGRSAAALARWAAARRGRDGWRQPRPKRWRHGGGEEIAVRPPHRCHCVCWRAPNAHVRLASMGGRTGVACCTHMAVAYVHVRESHLLYQESESSAKSAGSFSVFFFGTCTCKKQ